MKDLNLASSQITEVLRLFVATTGLNTKFDIRAKPNGIPELHIDFSGPDAANLKNDGGELLLALEHIAREIRMPDRPELVSCRAAATFPYRVLLVDDDPIVREVGRRLLESNGYEVLCAEDGFEGLAALKQALPDLIISDLRMPNMNGFEFLSVVRKRFASISVIVISGEYSGITVPEHVLADAFFSKGQYNPESLFEKITELMHELPPRPRAGKPTKAAVWVKNERAHLAVTCSDCLLTFPVTSAIKGLNEVECDFCSCTVRFEVIGEHFVSAPKRSV